MSRSSRERDQLLDAVNDLLDRASDAEAAGPIPGNPSSYVSSVDMTCAMLRSIRFQDPAEAEGAAEQVRELVDELAVANAKLTELAAISERSKTPQKRPIVGMEFTTGLPVVGVPGGGVYPVYTRRAGKQAFCDGGVIPGSRPEDVVRNEVLTKVIEALQLETYGFRSSPESGNPFAAFLSLPSKPKLSPADFWADIESTLADREDDAEFDRVQAARKRIESITGIVDETEPEEFALAGETLADAA